MVKKLLMIFCAVILVLSSGCVFAFAEDAEEESKPDAALLYLLLSHQEPFVYIPDESGEIGDEIGIKLFLGNAQGLTNGTFVIEYNPYMLQFEGFTPSSVMSSRNIFFDVTEQTGAGAKDQNGEPMHEVFVSLLHMKNFSASKSNCSLGTFHFKVIGGGQCALKLHAPVFRIRGKDVTPTLFSGVADLKGEQAPEWDYAEDDLTDPSPDRDLQAASGIGAIIGTVCFVSVVLAACGVVIFFVARSKKLIDAVDSESDRAKIN